MIQYGLMYVSYIYAYQFLNAHQVALFTIFTPLYVTLIADMLERRFHSLFLVTALIAIGGTGIIVYQDWSQSDLRVGLFVLQISNICFAFGQVSYKRIMNRHQQVKDWHIFGLLYLGAVLLTAAFTCFTTDWGTIQLTMRQTLTLLYLGVVASGICFFLWNFGAKRVNAGALAILNNLKVPLAVACSLVFFHEQGNIPKLFVGGVIILTALFLNEGWLKRLIKDR